MGTQNVNLPVVAGGLGAATLISHLGAKKTFILGGVAGSITIEASDDGVNFCPVASFTGAETDDTLTILAAYLRVDASGGSASSVEAVAERGLNRFGSVPAPPVSGPGASLDISDFGCLTTVMASGITGNIGIEVSADGVNWSEAFKTFTSDGCDTEDISAKFIRAVGKGGTGTIFVGSEEPAISAVTAPSPTIVFRPEATGDEAPGGNVYTTWAEAYAALQSSEHLGIRFLEWDSEFSTHIAGNGRSACVLPAGAWHFENVVWTNPVGGFPGDTIDIADGATITGLEFIDGHVLNIIYDGVTPGSSPFTMDTGGITIIGPRTQFFNTIVGAAPMFSNAVAGGFFFIAQSGINTFGGLLTHNGAAMPSPLIDLFDGFVLLGTGAGGIQDDVLTDTSGPATGFCRYRLLTSGAAAGPSPTANNYVNTALPATATLNPDVEHRTRSRVSGVVDAAASPFDAGFGWTIPVDTTGAVTINLPSANPAKGEKVTVKDVTGNATAMPVTIAAQAGETVEGAASVLLALDGQSMTFEADGAGNWMLVADAEALDKPVALGGGAAATLGTIGGAGPAAAAQATWVQVNIDIGGVLTPHWIPAWL